MSKFKVGDWVRRTATTPRYGVEVGVVVPTQNSIYKVVSIEQWGGNFTHDLPGCDSGWSTDDSCYELATSPIAPEPAVLPEVPQYFSPIVAQMKLDKVNQLKEERRLADVAFGIARKEYNQYIANQPEPFKPV